MKKLALLTLLCAACTIVKSQGFLNLGAGANKFKTPVISLSVGYQMSHVVTEFEMKTPPISTQVDNPSTFTFKTGYEIKLGKNVAFLPQIQSSYLYYSADEAKGATLKGEAQGTTWKNGWKAGIGGRIRWGHLFAQADFAGGTYMSVGICAQFKKQQSW